ncbi:MAG TPA: c-type cytochrome biogenesis protein CcsB [Nitrospirota bacterium]|nr:c-type cytochrome biogenesis protein CcsB [Nitrospirota bacterium]
MESSLLFNIATLSYLLAMVLYISYLAFKKNGIGKAASGVTYFGLVVQTIALLLRWRESYQMDIGRVPLSNLYESLVFFTWSMVLIYVIVEYKYKTRAFGAFVMPVAFLALAFINVSGVSAEITPLVPALKSNWLFYHVMISFLGYAAFGVAFAISMIYLLMDTEERGPIVNLAYALGAIVVLAALGYYMASLGERMKTAFWMGIGVLVLIWFIYLVTTGAKNRPQVFLFWSLCVTLAIGLLTAMGIDFFYLITLKHLAAGESFKKHMFESTFLSSSVSIALVSWAAVIGLFGLVWSQGMKLKNLLKQYMPAQDQLDDVTYRMIAIGWPLLTGGIITGAVWANSAWGTYWGWDPKETWSLITWFIYAIYLHARYVRGWKGTQMAVISAVGFLAVIFTYLGVNLVLSGLHSYGGMN